MKIRNCNKGGNSYPSRQGRFKNFGTPCKAFVCPPPQVHLRYTVSNQIYSQYRTRFIKWILLAFLIQKITHLTLIVPRAWKIGYMQPCINCRGKSATHFVYFWSRKTLPYTHLEATCNVKAFTSEPLPCLLQAVTKISTLHNFYEWRI